MKLPLLPKMLKTFHRHTCADPHIISYHHKIFSIVLQLEFSVWLPSIYRYLSKFCSCSCQRVAFDQPPEECVSKVCVCERTSLKQSKSKRLFKKFNNLNICIVFYVAPPRLFICPYISCKRKQCSFFSATFSFDPPV